MPLLSRRRSLLDLLNESNDNELKRELSYLPPESAPQRPKSEYGYSRSRLSHEVRREDLPEEQSQDAARGRAKRFSMLKMRNFSESHLSVKAKEVEKQDMENTPPVPAMPSNSSVPAIVKTAPTMHHSATQEEQEPAKERKVRPSLFKRSLSKGRSPDKREPRKSIDDKRGEKKGSSLRWRKLQGRSTGLEDLQRLSAAHAASNQVAPPSYGDESSSALALPVSGHRFSESSRSDGSNGSDQIFGSTTTTTHTVSTHTTFFKLPRRNKNRNSLFPPHVRIPPPNEDAESQDDPPTPRASISALSTKSQQITPNGRNAHAPVPQRRHTETSPIKHQHPPLPVNAALAKSSLSFAQPGMNLGRTDSQRSRASSNSSPLKPPMRLGMRDRASTTSLFGRVSYDMGTPPPLTASGRNSTSTTGRSSLGGLLNLSRFRQSSDPHSPRHGSPGTNSKSNSFAMSREALVVPEREEGDTPSKYLERLEAAVARSMIAGILAKSADPFAQAVLRSYTRRFPFFGEPIDMSLRKFLLEAELPKETQQVDRVIQAFADRYHECNPGIFVSSDQAYILAFSLMMLHTDAFNRNNKRKMQKLDYIKNTTGQQVSDDVLACFYDNICYTPFVHYDEEVDINGERVLPFKPKKNKVKAAITDTGKRPSGPVDPYNLLVDQKLEMLRPPIQDSITMEDPYNYRGSHAELDPSYLQRAFTHTGTLQIVSQRSRPTAYEGQFNNSEPQNPMEMQPGIIDIKITKVSTLWRKAAKKKKARSPWQEWGAILTGSQLYLFKNAHWAKGLLHQFLANQRVGTPRSPVVFRPPLQEFKPDALIKTDNAVALVDSTYTRHKHAFTFVGPGGEDEVFLADNESELSDWLALINYAAAFRAAGVRIRGMVGGAEEDGRSKDVQRLNSTQSARSLGSTGGELTIQNRGLSPQLQRQVMAARCQIMMQKIVEARKEIAEASKQLDNMLRSARHLLILAPIAPKTREDVARAADNMDTNIKLTRRAIWRMKCHRDILAMDVQQDGVPASEIENLAEQQVEAPESAKKTKIKGLSRLNSKASAKASAARSPPQSPTSPRYVKRPSTTGSLSTYTDDIFRTPIEPKTPQPAGDWRLPPLQLDVQPEERHRYSVASTLLTASSQDRKSLSRGTSTSSARRVERFTTAETFEGMSQSRKTSTPSIEDVEMLARTNSPLDPIVSRTKNMDGAPLTSTPESSKQRSAVRRSLQKTLRDAHHHHPSTIHKHKKGKESDNTVRSATRENDFDDLQEGTPGLKREKGRFILHGKQASVVQFGSDWPDERMKARREAWRQNSQTSISSQRLDQGQRTPRPFGYWGRADVFSPMVHDFTQQHNGLQMESDETGTLTPPMSPHGDDLKEDAEAADMFARSESPTALSSSASASASDVEPERWGSAMEYYDMSPQFDMHNEPKRSTVIGPRRYHQRKLSLLKAEDGNVVSATGTEDEAEAEDDDDEEGEEIPLANKRQTVIGPTWQPVQANGGAEEEEVEDEFVNVNQDDGKSRYRSHLKPVEVA